ncbi:hypothetical protein SteCoe_2360 [Stentor coeruleus]|uniref:START domain-containing protein n=1 Tax=Stentor coeruleus TaxID=5963 RepID=A0A1R2CZM8_9CILI|nr:hypothetical protein SteCoe_2360 [Stentor coeruleus]
MTIPLVDLNNGLQISYRFINNQLQFHAIFAVESNFETIVNLLVKPESRKKWDLKLVDIEKLSNENENLCLKMLYSQDKCLYEFHNDVHVNWSIYHTTVNFCSNKSTNIKAKGILGNMSSYYKLENLSKADSSFALNYKSHGIKKVASCIDNLQESIKSHLELIKVTWKASFCEHSKKMFIADCLEETNLLKNTIAGLIHLAEKPSESIQRSPQNTLFNACERKRLKSSV